MDEWQFWFAIDTFAILNSLSATYSCEQMDKEWIPQVEKWATQKNSKRTPIVNF